MENINLFLENIFIKRKRLNLLPQKTSKTTFFYGRFTDPFRCLEVLVWKWKFLSSIVTWYHSAWHWSLIVNNNNNNTNNNNNDDDNNNNNNNNNNNKNNDDDDDDDDNNNNIQSFLMKASDGTSWSLVGNTLQWHARFTWDKLLPNYLDSRLPQLMIIWISIIFFIFLFIY